MKRSLCCLAVSLAVMACGAGEGAGDIVARDIAARSDALCVPAVVGTYRLRNNFTSDCIRATASAIVMASSCNGADRNWTLFQMQALPGTGCPSNAHWYQAANGNGTMTSVGDTVAYDSGNQVLDAWVPEGTNAFISFSDSSSCLHETASQTLNFSTCGTNNRSRWTALPAY